jgi:hypothetical protein
VDAFMHHPLAIVLPSGWDEEAGDDAVRWTCRTSVPDAREFEFIMRPGAEQGLPHYHWSPALRWMKLRGIEPKARNQAIMSLERKEIYHVDFTAERRGKLCLVLLYCPGTPSPAWAPAMLKHAEHVKTVCKEQYALEPEVALLRLSVDGNSVQGLFVR